MSLHEWVLTWASALSAGEFLHFIFLTKNKLELPWVISITQKWETLFLEEFPKDRQSSSLDFYLWAIQTENSRISFIWTMLPHWHNSIIKNIFRKLLYNMLYGYQWRMTLLSYVLWGPMAEVSYWSVNLSTEQQFFFYWIEVVKPKS